MEAALAQKRKANALASLGKEQEASFETETETETDRQKFKKIDDTDVKNAKGGSENNSSNSTNLPVTVSAPVPAPASKSASAPGPAIAQNYKYKSKNSYSKIRRCIIQNDGKPESMVKLIGLKNLFSKGLPKMPRDYIVRLVFDRRHKSLAILSSDADLERNPAVEGTDDEIVGAICYRAYHEMKFAEIAFCAVAQSQQVKGYGTKLMNLLKMHAVTEGVEYFITYADNYATGYFKKQGFTRTITMPKSRFHGLIKDYDGGTLMECYVHPSIDYTRIPEMIKAQKEYILDRVRDVSKSDKVVYPPLPRGWTPDGQARANANANGNGNGNANANSLEAGSGAHSGNSLRKNTRGGKTKTGMIIPTLSSRGNEAALRAMAIPGMAEAGWTMTDLLASTAAAKDNDRQRNHLKSELLTIIRKVEDQQFAWPFREPVDTTEVTDYLGVVKEPIDLSTMDKRIRKGDWYKSKQHLQVDMMMMVNNCKAYNDATSQYFECATNLEKFLKVIFQDA